MYYQSSCRSCNTLLDFQFVTGTLKARGSGNSSASPVADSTQSPGSGELAAGAATDISNTSADQPLLIPGSKTYSKSGPADVEELGRSSWTLLHTIAAKYPNKPSDTQKQEMKQFMTIFSHVYPCGWCAKDFELFIKENAPKVDSKDDLGRWICAAHNEVNEKLGKEKFNCDLWKKRWVDGWD